MSWTCSRALYFQFSLFFRPRCSPARFARFRVPLAPS
nr:MAG: hypothetical protein [Molluscum contagiosum virus]